MEKHNLHIETERLIIRPYNIHDYKNWYSQLDRRLPAQSKYDDGRPLDMSSYTEEWFMNWTQRFHQLALKDEMYILGTFRKEDGVNVGKVELVKLARMDYQWGMMGYSIHNQFWRQGYGTESVIAGREAFFKELGFHRVELHINVDNEPSIGLAEKTGFLYECTRKEFTFENNQWTDMLIYYKNRD